MKFLRTFVTFAALAAGAVPVAPVAATRASFMVSLSIVDRCTVVSDNTTTASVLCDRQSPSHVSYGAAVPPLTSQPIEMSLSAHRQILTVEF